MQEDNIYFVVLFYDNILTNLINNKEFYMKQLKTKGFLVVLGAVLLQLCIGSIYSWSLFNEPIATYLDISKSKVVLTFSITVFVFAFVTIFSGKLQDKIGAKAIIRGGIFDGYTGKITELDFPKSKVTVVMDNSAISVEVNLTDIELI